jgi:hypothetical protein
MPSIPAIVRSALPLACVAALLLASSSARAQSPPPPASTDKVAAEALFEDGRRLLAAGNFAEACPKFAASERLDPSPGTLLNLASCYEKVGKVATAWATYREAASAANAAGRNEYVATAQRHAEALAPKLPRLSVTVTQPVEGMQITRDGVRVERGEWGTPIPIDPGTHTIEVSAPGHKPWQSGVEVRPDSLQLSVSVPLLEALPVDTAAPAPPPPTSPPPGPALPPVVPAVPQDTVSRGGGQRVLGLIMAGAGVVGLGVGGGFAFSAKSQYNTSLSNCETGNPGQCNSTGVSQRDSARSAGNVATVAVIAGGAVLAGGVVIWLTAPQGTVTVQRGGQPPSNAPRIGIVPTLGGGLIEGAW